MMRSGKIIKKYDDEGIEIFCEVFDGSKSIRSYSNYNEKRYESYGNIIFQEFWDYGKLYSRDSSYYIYDEGGNIIEKQYFVWRDNNFYKLSFSKYTYDSFGKRMKGQLYRGNEYADSTLFIYSENGNLVREEYYPSILNGRMRGFKEFEYSDKNELIKKTVYGIDGELDYEEGIKFNKNAQKVERYTVHSEYDKEGNQVYDFKKKYDSFGRIIMHTKILPGKENERGPANKWEFFYE